MIAWKREFCKILSSMLAITLALGGVCDAATARTSRVASRATANVSKKSNAVVSRATVNRVVPNTNVTNGADAKKTTVTSRATSSRATTNVTAVKTSDADVKKPAAVSRTTTNRTTTQTRATNKTNTVASRAATGRSHTLKRNVAARAVVVNASNSTPPLSGISYKVSVEGDLLDYPPIQKYMALSGGSSNHTIWFLAKAGHLPDLSGLVTNLGNGDLIFDGGDYYNSDGRPTNKSLNSSSSIRLSATQKGQMNTRKVRRYSAAETGTNRPVSQQSEFVCTSVNNDLGGITEYVSCDYFPNGIPTDTGLRRKTLNVKASKSGSIKVALPGQSGTHSNFYVSFYDGNTFDLTGIVPQLSNSGSGAEGIFTDSFGDGKRGLGDKYFDAAGVATQYTDSFVSGTSNSNMTNAYIGWVGGATSSATYAGPRDDATRCPKIGDDDYPWVGWSFVNVEKPIRKRYVTGRGDDAGNIMECGIIITYDNGLCRLAKWNGEAYDDVYFYGKDWKGDNTFWWFEPVVDCNKTDSYLDAAATLEGLQSVYPYSSIDIGIEYDKTLPSIAPVIAVEHLLSPNSSFTGGYLSPFGRDNDTRLWDSLGNPIKTVSNISQFHGADWSRRPTGAYAFDTTGLNESSCPSTPVPIIEEIEKMHPGDRMEGWTDNTKSVVRAISVDDDGMFNVMRDCAYLLKDKYNQCWLWVSAYASRPVKYGIIDCEVTDDNFRAAAKNGNIYQNPSAIWCSYQRAVDYGDDFECYETKAISLTLTKQNSQTDGLSFPSLENLVDNMSCACEGADHCICDGKEFAGIFGADECTEQAVQIYDSAGKPIKANMPAEPKCQSKTYTMHWCDTSDHQVVSNDCSNGADYGRTDGGCVDFGCKCESGYYPSGNTCMEVSQGSQTPQPVVPCEDGDFAVGSECVKSKFKMITTNDVSGDFYFTVNMTGKLYINWGDGRTETKNLTASEDPYQILHTYPSTKSSYTIQLSTDTPTAYSKDQPTFGFKYYAHSSHEKKIKTISGSLGALFPILNGGADPERDIPLFAEAFEGAVNLESIPGEIFSGINMARQGMFSNTFAFCNKVTQIPANLFSGFSHYAPVSTMFHGTFQGLGIASVPEDLFAGIEGAPAEHMFGWTFAGCDKLTTLKPWFRNISGPAAQGMYAGTFKNCTGITSSIPSNLFGNITGPFAVNMFGGTFEGDMNITGSIPENLFGGSSLYGAPKDSMFAGTFEDCNNITGTIPENLFGGTRISGAPAAAMFASTFAFTGISGQIPENLFGGTNLTGAPANGMFMETFHACPSLDGTIPDNLFGALSGPFTDDIFRETFSNTAHITGFVPKSMYNGLTGNNAAYAYIHTFLGAEGMDQECPSGSAPMTEINNKYQDLWDGVVACLATNPQQCIGSNCGGTGGGGVSEQCDFENHQTQGEGCDGAQYYVAGGCAKTGCRCEDNYYPDEDGVCQKIPAGAYYNNNHCSDGAAETGKIYGCLNIKYYSCGVDELTVVSNDGKSCVNPCGSLENAGSFQGCDAADNDRCVAKYCQCYTNYKVDSATGKCVFDEGSVTPPEPQDECTGTGEEKTTTSCYWDSETSYANFDYYEAECVRKGCKCKTGYYSLNGTCHVVPDNVDYYHGHCISGPDPAGTFEGCLLQYHKCQTGFVISSNGKSCVSPCEGKGAGTVATSECQNGDETGCVAKHCRCGGGYVVQGGQCVVDSSLAQNCSSIANAEYLDWTCEAGSNTVYWEDYKDKGCVALNCRCKDDYYKLGNECRSEINDAPENGEYYYGCSEAAPNYTLWGCVSPGFRCDQDAYVYNGRCVDPCNGINQAYVDDSCSSVSGTSELSGCVAKYCRCNTGFKNVSGQCEFGLNDFKYDSTLDESCTSIDDDYTLNGCAKLGERCDNGINVNGFCYSICNNVGGIDDGYFGYDASCTNVSADGTKNGCVAKYCKCNNDYKSYKGGCFNATVTQSLTDAGVTSGEGVKRSSNCEDSDQSNFTENESTTSIKTCLVYGAGCSDGYVPNSAHTACVKTCVGQNEGTCYKNFFCVKDSYNTTEQVAGGCVGRGSACNSNMYRNNGRCQALPDGVENMVAESSACSYSITNGIVAGCVVKGYRCKDGYISNNGRCDEYCTRSDVNAAFSDQCSSADANGTQGGCPAIGCKCGTNQYVWDGKCINGPAEGTYEDDSDCGIDQVRTENYNNYMKGCAVYGRRCLDGYYVENGQCIKACDGIANAEPSTYCRTGSNSSFECVAKSCECKPAYKVEGGACVFALTEDIAADTPDSTCSAPTEGFNECMEAGSRCVGAYSHGGECYNPCYNNSGQEISSATASASCPSSTASYNYSSGVEEGCVAAYCRCINGKKSQNNACVN